MFVGSVEVISSNSMGSTLWGLGHVQYLLDVQVGQSSWIVYRRYSQFRDLDKSIRSVLGAEFLENEEINKGESGFNAELPPSNTIGMTRPQITSARLPSLNEYIRCATSFQAPEKSKSSIEALFCEFLDREHRGKSGMRISGSSVKRETFAKVSYPRNLLWRNVFIGLTSDGLLYVCKDLTTLAENADIKIAWEKALQTDTVSAFGGIVALNRELDAQLAHKLKSLFLEVIIAPSFTNESIIILGSKPNLRLLSTKTMPKPSEDGLFIKSIAGGMLVQTKDNHVLKKGELNFVTKKIPNPKEINDLLFAWKVAKHTKSNAIIYAKNLQTTGIGAGQMSRIDSTNIATNKALASAEIAKLDKPLTVGSVVASDAFFPFPDGLISAADAGVTAVIQPGGSIKDKEVIAAADERNISMIFTGIRHFKH